MLAKWTRRSLLAGARCAWMPDLAGPEELVAYLRAPGLLDGPEIADRLDDDERRRVAPFVRTDRAGIARVDIAADRTGQDPLLSDAHRLGEGPEQRLALTDEMQRDAARRARRGVRRVWSAPSRRAPPAWRARR